MAFSCSESPVTVLVEMTWEAPAAETKTAQAAKTARERTRRFIPGTSALDFAPSSRITRLVSPFRGSLSELLGQQPEREEPPGEIDVLGEEEHGSA